MLLKRYKHNTILKGEEADSMNIFQTSILTVQKDETNDEYFIFRTFVRLTASLSGSLER